VGGYAFFTIALNIFLLRKILNDLITGGNADDESLANAIIFTGIAVMTVVGAILCYVFMSQTPF